MIELEQVKQYIKLNNIEQAKAILENLLQKDNTNKEIYLELAKCYLNKEKEKSVEYLEKYVEFGGKDDNVFILLAKLYRECEKIEKANNILLKVKDQNTEDFLIEKFKVSIKKHNNEELINCMYRLTKISEKCDNEIRFILLKRSKEKWLFEGEDSLCKEIDIICKYIEKNDPDLDMIRMLSITLRKEEVVKNRTLKNKIIKILEENRINSKKLRAANIFLNEIEILEKKIVLKSKPKSLTIQLTSKCNLRCIMCHPVSSMEKDKIDNCIGNDMSEQNYKELIKLIPYLTELILQGGETFLYPKILDLLEEAYKNKVEIQVITNGLLLNQKSIQTLISCNATVNISIDGFNEEVYEKIRFGGKFKNLVSNLELIKKMRSEKKNSLKLRLLMVVMKSNYKQIENGLYFAKKYSFDEMNISPIRSGLSVQEECIFDISYNDDIVKYLQDNKSNFDNIARNLNIALNNMLPNIDDYNNMKKYKNEHLPQPIYDLEKTVLKNDVLDGPVFCCLPWTNAYIFSHNVMYPTCFCTHFTTFPKNQRQKTISELWNGREMMFYREAITRNEQHVICTRLCLKNNVVKNDMKQSWI